MRLFVAINLPAALRDSIARIRPDLVGAKWVAADALHITLRFIGSVADEHVPKVAETLEALRGEAFELELEPAGLFGRRGPPRILWVGVSAPARLLALQADIEADIAGLGFEPDNKDFHPHITVARFKRRARRTDVQKELEAFTPVVGRRVPVAAFHLMKSDLLPTGAEYTAVRRYALSTNPNA